MTRIPDGTDVCYYEYIQAKIGGYNGVDHLIVERDDGGPDIWSSNFVVGFCSVTPPPEPEPEWYDVFIDNAGYFVFFVFAGIAIDRIAR